MPVGVRFLGTRAKFRGSKGGCHGWRGNHFVEFLLRKGLKRKYFFASFN
jgi:hypothetical protein